MTSTPERTAVPSGVPVDDLRRMALLLETAAALEARARRCADPRQAVVLRRRADHRRQQAAAVRARLGARGAARRGSATQV